jgi:PIN domain
MRLMLDTNILLSALLSPLGAPTKLLDFWERKTFTPVACGALIAELPRTPRLLDITAHLFSVNPNSADCFLGHSRRKLTRKKKLTASQIATARMLIEAHDARPGVGELMSTC